MGLRIFMGFVFFELFSFSLFPQNESVIVRVEYFDFRLGIVKLIFCQDGAFNVFVLNEPTAFVSHVDDSTHSSKVIKDIV